MPEDFDWDEWAGERSKVGVETSVVPYSSRFKEPWEEPILEEPPTIEAEFRDVTPEPEEEFDKEEDKRRRRLAEEVEELEGLEKEGAFLTRRTKIEELKSLRRRFKGQHRPGIPQLAKKLQKVGTLGGVPKVQHMELYIPKPQRGLYVPSKAPSMGGEISSLREVSQPRLEKLRRAGSPGSGLGTPIARALVPSTKLAGGLGMDSVFQRLREASKLPVDRVEHAALEEIQANGDRDTVRHVVSELAQLGVSRMEAEGAIKGLLTRGVVRRTSDFEGEEPILEVIR